MCIRDRPGAQLILGILAAIAILGLTLGKGLLAPSDPLTGDIMVRFKPILYNGHWLGTDQLGRDLWTRVLAGFPWSLGIAFTATFIAMTLGTVAGLAAAWKPGSLNTMINRSVDMIIAFPGLVIAICVIAIVGRGFWPLALTLGVLLSLINI